MKGTGCSRQNSAIEASRTSLVWKSTQEEQNKADDCHNLVKEMFLEQISMPATDLSRGGESRRTKHMSLLDAMNNVDNEGTLDDQNSVKERTVVEQTSVTTSDLQMRMSRAGQSRRRIRRMQLDNLASYSWASDDVSSESRLDVCPTIQKLSSVSQRLLLQDPQAVVDGHLRSNSLCGSQAHNNHMLRWKQSTWGGEEDSGVPRGPHCPPAQYVMLHMQFSQHLPPEDNQPTMQKDDIFPGNTKDLSPLRVKELLAFKPHDDDSENHAKLGLADLQNSQEQSKFRVIGGSFSRIDTRSMKTYSNGELKAPSSLPTSPLGSSRESHSAWIFRKILRRGSQVSSEISTHRTKSWEPHRERTSKHIISSKSVVCEKCSVPRRPGTATQALLRSQESSTDETGNSWWPFKWRSQQSKELRHKPFKTALVVKDNKVNNIKAEEQVVVQHCKTSSATMYVDDYSLASCSKPARFTSASNNSQTIAWVLGMSPFAPEQRPCIQTLGTKKFLLPPRRLNEPCA